MSVDLNPNLGTLTIPSTSFESISDRHAVFHAKWQSLWLSRELPSLMHCQMLRPLFAAQAGASSYDVSPNIRLIQTRLR
jgi:hypothetical protein